MPDEMFEMPTSPPSGEPADSPDEPTEQAHKNPAARARRIAAVTAVVSAAGLAALIYALNDTDAASGPHVVGMVIPDELPLDGLRGPGRPGLDAQLGRVLLDDLGLQHQPLAGVIAKAVDGHGTAKGLGIRAPDGLRDREPHLAAVADAHSQAVLAGLGLAGDAHALHAGSSG